MRTVESARDRRRLARDAGVGQMSFPSVLAGTLVAFGAVATVLAVAGAIGANIGITLDGISTHEWRRAGIVGAVVATVVVLLSFSFGGYTAGRMGRRSGMRHGLAVFVLAAAVIAIVAGLTAWLSDTESIRRQLSDNGVPTNANTWSDIGIGAAIAVGVAMLVGALLGGTRGEQWHGKLVAAAAEKREQQLGPDEEPARPKHALGQDETTIDVRDEEQTAVQPSLEEEREQQRQARADVGM
jgi:hypothetical protein